ncbi:MAG: hypothetical protein ACOCWQ_05415 [Nanoarchaeota archaeon]
MRSAHPVMVFDTGPIITLTLNNLSWMIPVLKRIYGGEFLIPAAVKKELVDKPLCTKKYKLEALQIIPFLNDGTLKLVDHSETDALTEELAHDMNRIYYAKSHPVTIVHAGEIDAISCALQRGADALVVDERNTRYLIETPMRLCKRLEHKLHTKVTVDKDVLRKVRARLKGMRTIRTVEIITVAYEMGLVDRYLNPASTHPRQDLLEALLWGVKLNGCAVQVAEIDEIMKLERASKDL